jgi:hypothetical protein
VPARRAAVGGKPHRAPLAWSLPPARVALGSPVLAPTKAPAVGVSPLPCCPQRPGSEAHPPGATPSSWPAGGVRGPFPRGQAPVRRGTRSRQRSARGPNAPRGGGALARARRALRGAMAQEGALTPSRAPLASPAAVGTQVCSSLGRGAAPVWCHPRWRAATGKPRQNTLREMNDARTKTAEKTQKSALRERLSLDNRGPYKC